MGGWFETAGVILTALGGAVAGRIFSRLRNPHWAWGYLIPLVCVTLLFVAPYVSFGAFVPLFACISGGRTRFILVCLAVTMGSMTLLGRLQRPIEKALVFIVMIAVCVWSSVLPFLMPTLITADLRKLETKMDADNICYQTTDYTCGPAAAVTALRRLGLPASEGEIAVLSHTSPIAGTLPWCLYKAIQNRYASDGLECSFQHFDSVNQLRQADAALAVVRDAFMLDHCVAILDVGDDVVTIGDPILGKRRLSYKEFEDVWRFYGIVLKANHS